MVSQSLLSVGRAAYRICFRRGSPQRIQYADGRLVAAVGAFVMLGIASQLLFFRHDPIQTGLYLFASLSGLYIGSALLTRRVPRVRLRVTLLAVMVILACSQLLLALAFPLASAPGTVRFGFVVAVGSAALLGMSNCLQFALASSRAKALTWTLLFAAALAAFYGTMYPLLEIVFG